MWVGRQAHESVKPELDSCYAIGCHPCTSLNRERCVEDNSPERQHDPPSHRLQIIVLIEAVTASESIHRAERCVILMPFYGSRWAMDHDKVLVALVNTLLRPVIAGGPRRGVQCPLNTIPAQRTVGGVGAVGREISALRLGLFSINPNAVVSRLMRASDASGPPAKQIAASKYLG